MYQFPENDFADAQSNFDPFPDLSVFDEWQLDEDSEHPVLMPHDSGPMPHPIYHASEVHDESGGSSSQFGGHAGRRMKQSRERKKTHNERKKQRRGGGSRTNKMTSHGNLQKGDD
ncbi:uncharacterized protein LOC21387302 [Morus notabilis]|uniref:uncharacterized protein LOC21387302 n=1 Tax=Morus notabilis TaxID=981085 RepID=UPI000CED2E4C|nr:uncharacterized protein LOC21387302 [Morus notabilis]